MTARYVVAFAHRFTVYDFAAASAAHAIEKAARIEHARAPWTPGGHLAYVTDGDSLGRYELVALAHLDSAGAPCFEIDPDEGPIPVEIARRMLDTWGDEE